MSRQSKGFLVPALFALFSNCSTCPAPALSADCNGNGVEDGDDLAAGTSGDCNGNRVPDECDLLPVNFGFEKSASLDARFWTRDLVAEDLDGDGDTDLAAVHLSAISVFLKEAAGGFVAAGTSPTLDYARFGARGDLDGDGAPEILLYSPTSISSVQVLLNEGGGAFTPGNRLSIDLPVSDLALGDADGDGLLDLLVLTDPSYLERGEVRLLPGRGDGTFRDPVRFQVGKGPMEIVPSDLDGDGDLDLVVANRAEYLISTLANAGDGEFVLRQEFARPLDDPGLRAGLPAGDFDGDGDSDLALLLTGSEVRLYLNDGAARFTRGSKFPAGIPLAATVTPFVRDFDGDNDQDLVIFRQVLGGRPAMGVLLNGGPGSLKPGPRFEWRTSFDARALADLGGDGALEVAGLSGTTVVIFSSRPVALADDCDRNAIPDDCERDRDGDGIPDACQLRGLDCNSNRVPDGSEADCNRNHSPDDCDVASGSSPDCNRNRIPDECELPLGDFNANGIPDVCDLPSGVLQDCDGNGIPDRQDLVPGFRISAAEIMVWPGTDFLIAADLDGDGRPDLAAFDSNEVKVLKQGGNGMLGIVGSFPLPGRIGAAGDLDGDGDLDLMGSAFSGEEWRIPFLLNRGNGAFDQGGTLRLVEAATAIAAADVDGDGRVDVAAGAGQGTWLFRNRGGAGFAPAEEVDPLYRVVLAADLDGDRDVDLVTGSGPILWNDGSGRYSRESAPLGFPGGIAADLNGDGLEDLLAGSRVFLNGGGGSFRSDLILPGAYRTTAAAGDLDGDADQDVVLIHSGGAIPVFLNLGNGTFSPHASYRAGHDLTAMSAGDFDGDGDLDAAVAGSRTIAILRNRGEGSLDGRKAYAVWWGINAGTAADLDGDGDADVAVTTYGAIGPRGLRILENRGSGELVEDFQLPLEQSFNSLQSADLIGDALPDLIASDWSSPHLWVFRNGPGEGFAPPGALPTGGTPRAFAPADLDGDGGVDLVVASENDQESLTVLLNRGNGVFSSPGSPALEPLAWSLLPFDFDGDGDLDLGVGSYQHPEGKVSLFENDGKGTLSDAGEIPLTAGAVSLAAGDLNGDGDLDLAVGMNGAIPCVSPFFGCGDESHAGILLNQGNGNFVQRATHDSPMSPHSLALSDLDGDGDTDLVVAHTARSGGDYLEYGTDFEVLLNGGKGDFTSGGTFSVGVRPFAVFAADLDGQGLPEIVVISEGSVSVFQNRTVPAAPDANRNGVPDRCEDARLRRGDANGDGAMDISDALHLLGGLFLGTAAPACDKAADASDDGKLDVSDPILVLGVLFLDQGSIPEPAGRCGPDPTPDALTCESFSGCP